MKKTQNNELIDISEMATNFLIFSGQQTLRNGFRDIRLSHIQKPSIDFCSTNRLSAFLMMGTCNSQISLCFRKIYWPSRTFIAFLIWLSPLTWIFFEIAIFVEGFMWTPYNMLQFPSLIIITIYYYLLSFSTKSNLQ